VRVRTPQSTELQAVLAAPTVTVARIDTDLLDIRGLPAERIGQLAFDHGIVLYELTPQLASLEQAYMDMTRDSVEYHASTPATTGTAS
jgi:ABC-2 type transport system ATP-binding protein